VGSPVLIQPGIAEPLHIAFLGLEMLQSVGDHGGKDSFLGLSGFFRRVVEQRFVQMVVVVYS
jgi:hypothetical protein